MASHTPQGAKDLKWCLDRALLVLGARARHVQVQVQTIPLRGLGRRLDESQPDLRAVTRHEDAVRLLHDLPADEVADRAMRLAREALRNAVRSLDRT